MTSYSDDNASTTMQPTKTKENKQLKLFTEQDL